MKSKNDNSVNSKRKKAIGIKATSVAYIQSSYTVVRKDDIKIYNPSVISTRKRVISA